MLKKVSQYSFLLTQKFIAWSLEKGGIKNIGGHFIYLPTLTNNPVIVDLGANKGIFYSEISSQFNCKCYAVEASPELFETLPKIAGLQKFNFAIHSENEQLEFTLSNNNEANSINSIIVSEWGEKSKIKIQGKTLITFIAEQNINKIDLLKIDVEGSEMNIFRSTTDLCFSSIIHQIAVEFHDFLDPSYLPEIKLIISRMENLGYKIIKISDFDYREVTMINTNKIRLKKTELFFIDFIYPKMKFVQKIRVKTAHLLNGKKN